MGAGHANPWTQLWTGAASLAEPSAFVVKVAAARQRIHVVQRPHKRSCPVDGERPRTRQNLKPNASESRHKEVSSWPDFPVEAAIIAKSFVSLGARKAISRKAPGNAVVPYTASKAVQNARRGAKAMTLGS